MNDLSNQAWVGVTPAKTLEFDSKRNANNTKDFFLSLLGFHSSRLQMFRELPVTSKFLVTEVLYNSQNTYSRSHFSGNSVMAGPIFTFFLTFAEFT